MSAAVSFPCTVYKVQTLVDGGLRITLDLPEQATEAAHQLMNLRNLALIAIVAEAIVDIQTDAGLPPEIAAALVSL